MSDDRDYLGKLFRVKCPEFEFNPIKNQNLEPPKYVEILRNLLMKTTLLPHQQEAINKILKLKTLLYLWKWGQEKVEL